MLDLSQTGNDVVGTFSFGPTAIAVSGTVAGGVLELRGEDSRVISGGSEEGDGTRVYSATYHSVEIVSKALIN